ncbi:unnamed protein product [Caenorhabditis auriculariae]|uniref:Uncharacterized protein n=1 Tax=Caenorhabditis auriculariae TaxID=2777116 RepID=A0A8S1GWP9_9PELO|nr:unnamed protein product [Caenorhabditis auriculariae]
MRCISGLVLTAAAAATTTVAAPTQEFHDWGFFQELVAGSMKQPTHAKPRLVVQGREKLNEAQSNRLDAASFWLPALFLFKMIDSSTIILAPDVTFTCPPRTFNSLLAFRSYLYGSTAFTTFRWGEMRVTEPTNEDGFVIEGNYLTADGVYPFNLIFERLGTDYKLKKAWLSSC